MRLYLYRHGRTASNLRKCYIGRTDEPLCETGIRELEGKEAPAVPALFCSPMKRCLESAAILWPELSPAVIGDLRECDFGAFEKKNWQDLSGNPEYQAWIDSGGKLPFPGGESQEEFRARVRRGFLQLVREMEKRQLELAGCMVHGGTIMAVMDAWSDPHEDYYSWQLGNGGHLLLEIARTGEQELSLKVLEMEK